MGAGRQSSAQCQEAADIVVDGIGRRRRECRGDYFTASEWRRDDAITIEQIIDPAQEAWNIRVTGAGVGIALVLKLLRLLGRRGRDSERESNSGGD
jgi:hypothetical protein